MSPAKLPVVVIGAGPIGLAAAAHLLAKGLTPLVIEAGAEAGANISRWGHVRMFSPWEYNIDKQAAKLLGAAGWTTPDLHAYPTGRELLDLYLLPLACHPVVRDCLRLETKVLAVSKAGVDGLTSKGRAAAPFLVRVSAPHGEEDILASAVIDASGTFGTPNWMGASGIPALGEMDAQPHVFYGIPEVIGSLRERYKDRRVLVVGSGHSAFNSLQDLVQLSAEAPDTKVYWAIRGHSFAKLLGGGENDKLAARGNLGLQIKELLERRHITLFQGVSINRIETTGKGLVVHGNSESLPPVNEIIVATGFRPDLRVLGELRLALDPATQSPTRLAPLIDPNEHSCGTVRPHGIDELSHPDDGVFIVGMKSYGRAPTFLLLTGYEQVRSVVAGLAGNWEEARRVELELPETGVCSRQLEEEATALSCCGAASEASQLQPPQAGCCSPTSRA